jgi:hypothetical protein
MGAANVDLSAPPDLPSGLSIPSPVAPQAPISDGWALVAAPRLVLAPTALHMSVPVAPASTAHTSLTALSLALMPG